MTAALQARETRNQSLTSSDKQRKNGGKNQLSEKKVQKARNIRKLLIDGEDLPGDLLARIFGRLRTIDLLGCAAVCRRWQQVVGELTGNAFTYTLDLECPLCHAEVGDSRMSNLQRIVRMTDDRPTICHCRCEVIGTGSALTHACGAIRRNAYVRCKNTNEHSCSSSYARVSQAV